MPTLGWHFFWHQYIDTVVAAKFSASAKEKIEKAGGTAKVAE